MDMTTQQAIDKLRRIREEAELMLTGERVGEFSISINSFNELGRRGCKDIRYHSAEGKFLDEKIPIRIL